MDQHQPDKNHDAHAQPHQDPEDDADLQSFIQSGMGIALPALSMGMDVHDGHDGHEGNSGDAEHHEDAGFEVGDFRELMRDGAGERQQDKQGMSGDGEGEREALGSHGGDEEEARGQKRPREEGTHDAEEDGTSTPGGANQDAALQRTKRTRTADASPSLDVPLHESPSNAIHPSDSIHQETTLTSLSVSGNADADMTPLMTPPIGRPEESAEERKARQREANRLAAGRSRGKKRDEL